MIRPLLGALLVVVSILSEQATPIAPLVDNDTVFIDTSPAMATGLYHREGCPWLTRSGGLVPLKVRDAKARYFQSHCECVTGVPGFPPCPTASSLTTLVPATNPSAATRAASTNVAETVFVTRTGDKYHRAGCRHLAKSAIAMSLKEAAQRYVPCSTCKPPVLDKSATAVTPIEVEAPRTTTPSPTAAASRRCAAITKKGVQCSRTARPGSAYCWQHGG